MEVAKLAAPPNLEVRFVSCNESAIKRWLSSALEETVFSLTHELFMSKHHTVTLRHILTETSGLGKLQQVLNACRVQDQAPGCSDVSTPGPIRALARVNLLCALVNFAPARLYTLLTNYILKESFITYYQKK